jgi:hypothetical protein
MSSVTNPQSEPPNSDELVAYLDGELPPEDCRAVEERLAADAEYRQQLRDLDQAWEALSALPPATVDDSFARTTIELACVAAEEDLSQQKSLAEVEGRGRKRWWIAGSVAAVVMGFLMVRALAVHRNNAVLTDLPLIQQSHVLSLVGDVEFLRQLASDVPQDEFVADPAAFNRNLADFSKANSESLAERRDWVNSLSPDQKANLADRARAFEAERQSRSEKDRLRELAEEVRGKPELEKALVAYGQWVARTPGRAEQLRNAFAELSTSERVAEVQKLAHQDSEQAARHLSDADAANLRGEILKLAKEKQPELLQKIPASREHDRISSLDAAKPGQALFIVLAAIRNNEYGEATTDELVSKLSPEAQEHWNKLGRGRRERWFQVWQWMWDALNPKLGPEELEQFFVSDKLTPDERQKLLELPRSEMKSKLQQLYLSSQFGIENRMQFFREFGEGGRGPRGGPGPFEPRGPGPRPLDFGDGPRFGPGRPPSERFERGGPPGSERRGPRPDDRMDDGRRGDRRRGPANDQRPPDGPPPRGEDQ